MTANENMDMTRIGEGFQVFTQLTKENSADKMLLNFAVSAVIYRWLSKLLPQIHFVS